MTWMGGTEVSVGGRLQRERICGYLMLVHVAV